MTNTYNTGNPLGSIDPRDLLDNASNLDDAMNSALPTFTDRLGVSRDTWAGQEAAFDLSQVGREAEFQAFLVSSGFISLGNYAGGISVTAYNEYVAFGGFFYRPAASSIPFVTSGTWVGDDENKFVLLSPDDVLRQDLADDVDPAKGAALVGFKRAVLADTIATVSQMLSAQARSIWEFADAVVSKPVPADPETWDWYPAFEAARAYFDANGGALVITPHLFLTSDEVRLSSNTEYACLGTIRLTAASAGGALLAPYGVSNISWTGGILDCNNILGQNAIGTSGSAAVVDNHVYRGVTVKNARWDAVILGGKGFTIHQACRAVRFYDIIVEDCDIGFSVEGFDGKETAGNIIDGVLVRRTTRIGAWLLQGGIVAVDDPNNFSCMIDNIVFEDCSHAAGFGIVSSDRGNGVSMRAFINNYTASIPITPFRGTITNSRVELDIDIDSVSDCLDFRAHTGGQPAADSYNLVFDARMVVRTTSAGYLVRYSPGSNDLNKADIRVAFDNFIGTGLMSSANATILFDFRRLNDGFRVYGRSEDGVAPTFSSTFREKLGSNLETSGVIFARSGGNLVGIVRAAVSGDQLDLQDSTGAVMVRTKEPASGEAGLLVRNNNGAARLSQVTLGATDSGGVGFKVLRVPN